MRTAWVVVPAIAAAAALGFVAQRWTHEREKMQASQPAPVAIDADATGPEAGVAPEAAAADAGATTEAPAPAIPDTLPQFELADREGTLRSLGEWKGRPLLVNYWATWCAPCRREIPLLNELRAEGRAPGLEVIGIAVDFRDDVLAYASETPINYPLLIGEEDGLAAVTAMGMQPAFPFTVFADSQQRILTVKIGELHRDDAELILDRLAAVDAGTLPLAQARAEIDAGLKELAVRRAAAEPGADTTAATGTDTAG
jgi:thiol-disulfide isomerase/thioredoxin